MALKYINMFKQYYNNLSFIGKFPIWMSCLFFTKFQQFICQLGLAWVVKRREVVILVDFSLASSRSILLEEWGHLVKDQDVEPVEHWANLFICFSFHYHLYIES